MNSTAKSSPFDLPGPALLCGISNASIHDIVDGWYASHVTDPNPTQVEKLYSKAGLDYPAKFTCFMAVTHEPKREWIQAYAMKKRSIVVRTAYELATSSPIAATIATQPTVEEIAALLSPGVILLAKPQIINELAVAAPGDISQIAGGKSKVLLSNLQELENEKQRRKHLGLLIQQANPAYCEVRLHRELCFSDIEVAYSLSEFLGYTSG